MGYTPLAPPVPWHNRCDFCDSEARSPSGKTCQNCGAPRPRPLGPGAVVLVPHHATPGLFLKVPRVFMQEGVSQQAPRQPLRVIPLEHIER